MKSLKVNIQPTGAFSTAIQSDTLFGLFCWNLVYQYGETRLEKLLGEYSTKPFILFSNGFENGKLPIPILEPVENSPQDMTFAKSIKKVKLIDSKDFLPLSKNLNGKFLNNHLIEKAKNELNNADLISTKKTEKNKASAIFLRNSINRNSNTVTDGLLYSTEETFYSENISFDVYLKYDPSLIKLEEVKTILEQMGKYGYGKDKSTGKGHFTVRFSENFDEQKYLHPTKGSEKYFFSLSNGLYSKEIDSNINLFYGRTFTKFPRMSGSYATTGKFLKNPIVLFEPGSSFIIQEQREYYGIASRDVFSDTFKDHYHSGYMIPFFFTYKEPQ